MTAKRSKSAGGPPSLLKDQYVKLATTSFVWREKAMSLRRAVDVLHAEAEKDWDERKRARAPLLQGKPPLEPPNVPPFEAVIMNLTASAIEALLKAIYIERHGALNEKGAIRNELITHALLKLC